MSLYSQMGQHSNASTVSQELNRPSNIATISSNASAITTSILVLILLYQIGFRFVVRYLLLHDRPPKGLKLVPGPVSTIPFLGRLHGVNAIAPWKTMHEFSNQYNKIFRLTAYGQMHIWVRDSKIAKDLLVKRAAKYSSRPAIAAIPGAEKGGQYLALNELDDHWRMQRRFAHTVFTASHRNNYHGIIQPEAKRMLYNLLEDPTDHFKQTDLFTARISARLCYGNASEASRHSRNAHEFIPQISPTASGPLMNIFPFLIHLPEWINTSKRWVRERRESERGLWVSELERVKRSLADGTAAPYSHARTYFERLEASKNNTGDTPADFGFPESEAAHAIGMLGTMAVFTIGGPLYTFSLVMTLHPEWQDRVKEEVDRVVGSDRIVDLSDSPDLPVLRACIKECLRWKPPVPLGVPRLVTEDDDYEGYHIPKGSVVHIIEQALSHDPEIYPEPTKYNPARWLEPEYPSYQEPLTVHPRLMGFSGFGSGRRVCPGIELTEAELLVACGSLVQNFEMLPNVDPKTGEKVVPDPENRNSNVIGGPTHFDFNLQVREGRAEKIRTMYEEVKDQLG
ncbi:hypothetical protein LTR70_000376 [Exophiala xenobiotica]|uniref:Cytochrome P450 n=1 Tax=Lithohypha guttulata TaxID=1690604 RepID=A0ABR0KPN8_9EURO|nr:hypothetical protein LTR24_000077 [Lithohypha guttulata]KAK5330546.1 hypothetical protein LTR70_000376 [Exophiala xenobiotica]